jgi:hypothetical protein
MNHFDAACNRCGGSSARKPEIPGISVFASADNNSWHLGHLSAPLFNGTPVVTEDAGQFA